MNTRTLLILAALALSLVLASAYGCKKEQSQNDSFIEKWHVLAENAQGHSPSYTPRQLDARQRVIEPPEPPDRPLPKRLITLRMHRASLAAVIQALSRAANQSVMLSPEIGGEVTVNIVKKPWDQVFKGILRTNGLTYRWEGDIIRVLTLDDLENDLRIAEVEARQKAQKLKSKGDEPLISDVIPIRYADADNLKETIEKILVVRDRTGTNAGGDNKNEMHGYVTVDNSTNSLVLEAAYQDLKKIYDLVDKLDKPRKQIRIKAHIVETSSNVARSLGIQWGGFFKSAANANGDSFYLTPGATEGDIDPDTGEWTDVPRVGTGINPSGLALNFIPENFPGTNLTGASLGLLFGQVGSSILEVQLNALASEGQLEILSSPSITTLDNQAAVTENGTRVPYVTINEDGQTEVQFEDAVLKLEITPHVIDEEFMRLAILIQKDEVDFTPSRTVDGYPTIIKRHSKTTLITRDNETIVISGLTRSHLSEGEAGIPGAKDIPVLGWLVKSQNKSDEKDDILIFITPTILAQWAPGEVQKTLEQIEEEVQAKKLQEQQDKEQESFDKEGLGKYEPMQ